MVQYGQKAVASRWAESPQGTVEHLEKILQSALPADIKIGEALYEVPAFGKAADDLSKIEIELEDATPDGYHISSSGVPYLRCLIGVEGSIPVCGMLYWDGKAIRGYLPVYGNSFNSKSKSAFGFEVDEAAADAGGEYELVVGGIPHKVSFESLDELYEFFEVAGPNIKPNMDACAQAFSSRVVANGELTDEAVEKACKKFRKVAEEFE